MLKLLEHFVFLFILRLTPLPPTSEDYIQYVHIYIDIVYVNYTRGVHVRHVAQGTTPRASYAGAHGGKDAFLFAQQQL